MTTRADCIRAVVSAGATEEQAADIVNAIMEEKKRLRAEGRLTPETLAEAWQARAPEVERLTALKRRRALDGKNPTQNTEEERRRALLEEYTDVIHCALVLDLEMDLDQIRKKTERWMRRLGIGEEDGN